LIQILEAPRAQGGKGLLSHTVSRSIPLILEKRGRKKRVRNTHGRGRGGAWEGSAGSVQAHGEKEG